MKKFFEALFVFCILTGLVLLALHTALAEKETFAYYENRNLAELPTAETETVLDGSYFSQMETYLSDHAAVRESLTTLDTAINLSFLHRPVVNEIVVQDEILLPYLDYQIVDAGAIAQQAQALADNLGVISDTVTAYGGVYCYVAVPGQYSYCADQYPDYLSSRSEYTALAVDTLSDVLCQRGIPFLDLGPVYAAAGSPMELSSSTDHHYSIFGAYTAYQAILETLNQDFGADFTILSRDDLTFTPVERHFLGSRARKIFDLSPIEQKIYTATPVNPVSFTRMDNGEPAGSFIYSTPAAQDTTITYDYYMGGDVGLTQIDTNRSAYPTVLLYGDSFTNAMECILYLSCDTMYAMDLRLYTDKTITEFISACQPDYVLCLRDYSVMLSTDGNGGTG